MTAVTPTDRPKSVRNSCVIKVFGGVFMLSRCFLDCSVGVGVFVTGLSQISSFFSFEGILKHRFVLFYFKKIVCLAYRSLIRVQYLKCAYLHIVNSIQ